MLKQIRNMIAALLFTGSLVLVPVMVSAQEGTSGSSSGSSSTSSSTTNKETEVETPEDKTPDANELKLRIESRKTEFKVKLAAAEELRLKAKCKAGQQVVKTLHGKISENVTTRTNAYQNLLNRLNKLVTQLKAASVDTTQLEAQIKTLSTKVDTYKTNLKDYRQALTDLQSQDCVSDPTGFKAALENARAKRETLSKTVLDIRTYVSGTIKPTLVAIRTSMEAKEKTTNSTTTTPTTNTNTTTTNTNGGSL